MMNLKAPEMNAAVVATAEVEVVTVANEPNAMKPVARQRIQNPIQAFRWASVVAPPVCL
jgi:hypothetical protein